ncbi:MAG: tRNA (adenosine(37)-N6)-dimethylallyltransferase MiaA [Bacteroidaceae bacterium]|nr:tRNA (adenosine(37)-N6)-dimethylallyltransferase MiaA [Bacteroidaceae bacterium]
MTLFVLLGPTAVGKTELSIQLAEFLASPIINCDSRQFFRELQIGTAPPTSKEMERVKHYFVGTLGLQDYYSAAQYEQEALQLINKLSETHQNLLLSGGSMMYIDAVCKGIDDIPTIDAETRQFMHKRLENEGLDVLLQELKIVDPEYYELVDRKNHKRVVHALEIYYSSGKNFSSFRTSIRKRRPFRIVKIGLRRERADLFDRINRRVDQMMENGLLDEAKRLYPYRMENSLNTVGYKELFNYLDGEWDLATAVERIKKNTRVYAKKQMTWFQKDKEIIWFHPNEYTEIENFVAKSM